MKNHIYAFILVISMSTCAGNMYLHAQCNNFDFDRGDFFNWTGKTGKYWGNYRPANIFEWTTQNISSGTLPTVNSVCSSYQPDEHSGRRFTLLPRRPPGTLPTDRFSSGGLPKYPNDTNCKYVVRLGNACDGAEAEALTFSYSPTLQNSLLLLNYALMIGSPHPGYGLDNPTFEIRVKADGVVTQELKCAELRINSDTRSPLVLQDTAFHTLPVGSSSPYYLYRSWSKVGIDLHLYQGQDIEVEIAIGDCSFSGHFGYAYFSGTCMPMELINWECASMPTTDTAAIVEAPEGYTYKWKKASDTTVVISTDRILALVDTDFTDNAALSLLCELTSLAIGTNGQGCITNLEIVVDNNKPLASFTHTFDTCDTTRTVNFASNSISRASELDTSSIEWDFGDGSPVVTGVVNPQHRYATPGIYIVKYKISSLMGCSSSVQDTLTITDPVGISLNKNTLPPEVNIFPNPTNGEIKVSSQKESLHILSVQVLDVTGKLAFESQTSTFNIGHLPNGIYSIRIHTNKGISVKKVVKQ